MVQRRLSGLTVALGTVCVFAASVATPAADALEPTPGTLSDIQAVAPEVLVGVATIERGIDSRAAIEFRQGADEVVVPLDPAHGILLSGAGGDLGIGLPNSDDASQGEVLAGGIVAYENGDGSTTVPVLKDDGSVQIVTVIEEPTAPHRYEYVLDLPVGATIELAKEGHILIWDIDGNLLAGAVAPWATGADGSAATTYFEVDGSTLVQIVEHEPTTAFPVIADPWLGKNLFGKVEKNRRGLFQKKATYSSVLSTWGTAVYTGIAQGGGIAGSVAGHAILRDAGWSELKSRLVGSSPAATLKQQYDCHVLGGYAVWMSGVHWDLELARPNNPNWLKGVDKHKCNW